MNPAELTRAYLLFIPLLCAVLPVSAQDRFQKLSERTSLEVEAQRHRVMAFYYPWYSMPDNPDESPNHWSDINRELLDVGGSPNYPVLGPYDSTNPELIDQHMAWAKNHNIDTLIVSWWGHGHYTDEAMKPILDAAAEHGLDITVYYEGVPDPKTPDSATEDLSKLLERYADHSAWLRVDGQPVVFVYVRAIKQIGLQGWAKVQQNLRNTGSTPPLLMGDQLSSMSALVFDGVHTYNTVNGMAGMTPEQIGTWAGNTYPEWVNMAEQSNRISTITVIPGYNDTEIREPAKRLPRYGGAVYRQQLEQVLNANPDWVLITSFNEWHEGTEIEPSVEYGHQFLELTDQFAESFRSQPLREEPLSGTGVSSDRLEALHQKWSDVRIGMLSGAESPVVPWLLTRLKVVPEEVTWQELVEDPPDPERMPMLMYGTDERFRETVNVKGDTLNALQSYMREGGLLMVCPAGPAPFFRNRNGEAISRAHTVGLMIETGGDNGIHGWESPPENQQFTFVQPDRRLPNLPESFSFPKNGDLRWRPFHPGKLNKKDRYTPLLRLRNGAGEFLGDSVAYVELNETEPHGGRLLYCWFRLLEMDKADALMYDLFRFTRTKIR